jgi:hypothetical protein
VTDADDGNNHLIARLLDFTSSERRFQVLEVESSSPPSEVLGTAAAKNLFRLQQWIVTKVRDVAQNLTTHRRRPLCQINTASSNLLHGLPLSAIVVDTSILELRPRTAWGKLLSIRSRRAAAQSFGVRDP